MPVIDGLECCIRIDGHDLPEYDRHGPTQRGSISTSSIEHISNLKTEPTNFSGPGFPLRSCYIPCRECTEFTIAISISPTFRRSYPNVSTIAIEVSLDGRRYQLGITHVNAAPWFTDEFQGVVTHNGTRVYRSLVFGKRPITDAYYGNEDWTDDVSQLGEIQIDIRRWETFALCPGEHCLCQSRPTSQAIHNLEGARSVQETLLKGRDLSVMAKLGALKRSVCAVPVWHGVHLDSSEAPFARFTFLYRSEHALRSLGVIPPTLLPALDNHEEGTDNSDGTMSADAHRGNTEGATTNTEADFDAERWLHSFVKQILEMGEASILRPTDLGPDANSRLEERKVKREASEEACEEAGAREPPRQKKRKIRTEMHVTNKDIQEEPEDYANF